MGRVPLHLVHGRLLSEVRCSIVRDESAFLGRAAHGGVFATNARSGIFPRHRHNLLPRYRPTRINIHVRVCIHVRCLVVYHDPNS